MNRKKQKKNWTRKTTHQYSMERRTYFGVNKTLLKTWHVLLTIFSKSMMWWFMPTIWMHVIDAFYFALVVFFEQQQQVSLLPVLQQHVSHLQSAPHFVVAHLQSKIENKKSFFFYFSGTKKSLENLTFASARHIGNNSFWLFLLQAIKLWSNRKFE